MTPDAMAGSGRTAGQGLPDSGIDNGARSAAPLSWALYRVAVLEVDRLLRAGTYADGRELGLEDLERLRLKLAEIRAELGLPA
jgi:hypothetical protein